MGECLRSKHEALGSISSTAQKGKKITYAGRWWFTPVIYLVGRLGWGGSPLEATLGKVSKTPSPK